MDPPNRQKYLPITSEDDNIWRKALKHGADVFSTHPILLEAILFVGSNQKYWTFSQYSRLSSTFGMRKQAKVTRRKLGDLEYWTCIMTRSSNSGKVVVYR
jgi:hypothetical protein